MNYGKINDDGCLSLREAPESKAKELFDQGWKQIDTARPDIECKENEIVKAIPFDDGKKIAFTYEKVIDKEAVRRKIEKLKKEIAETDYQVRKNYEYFMVGKPLPYDIQTIHAEAEEIRKEIRRLEEILK